MLSLGDKKRQSRAARGVEEAVRWVGREGKYAESLTVRLMQLGNMSLNMLPILLTVSLHKLHYNNAYCDVEVDGLHPHYVPPPPLAVQLSAQLSTPLSLSLCACVICKALK